MEVLSKYKETKDKLFQMFQVFPESKFVDTDGPVKRVHYLEVGEGSPLIIIHGGLSHSSEWLNILKPLSENFKCFVLDRPGHGLTDKINYTGEDYRLSAVNFIRSFMDAISLQKTYLMGNSMGGYFSTSFTLEYPEKVEKLLLIGAPAGMNYWVPPVLRLLGVKGLNRLLFKMSKPSIANTKKIHKQLLLKNIDNLSEEYYEHCYYNSLIPGTITAHRTMLQSVLTLKGWRKNLYITDHMKQLDIPIYFIWGDTDVFEGHVTGKEKSDTLKISEFKLIEDAGHCPWLDQPEACSEAIISMLKN